MPLHITFCVMASIKKSAGFISAGHGFPSISRNSRLFWHAPW